MILDYYRIFYYVAQYKSFSKAADVMGNNQPNITRCMNILENELGCKLFIRSNRGVQLTIEGERLFEHVSIAIEQLVSGENELHMWAVIGRSEESVDYEAYFPHRYHEEEFESDGFVQPFCDTPLDEEVVGEDVYLNIINKAKKYVYICTPYLIIDNEMMTALCLAAKSGVDVRIMTPGIPDKKLVFILTQSYYRQLLEAGVKIYEYQPGFLHAKSFVSDDEIGVVGTINLDYRSLYLHFEDGVWIYRNRVIQDIKDDFIQTMEYCRQIKPEFCLNRNIGLRIMQNIFRAFAPLM